MITFSISLDIFYSIIELSAIDIVSNPSLKETKNTSYSSSSSSNSLFLFEFLWKCINYQRITLLIPNQWLVSLDKGLAAREKLYKLENYPWFGEVLFYAMKGLTEAIS